MIALNEVEVKMSLLAATSQGGELARYLENPTCKPVLLAAAIGVGDVLLVDGPQPGISRENSFARLSWSGLTIMGLAAPRGFDLNGCFVSAVQSV